MRKSLKYKILLGLCRLFRTQKIMELPPNKIQKLFGKFFSKENIPKMKSDLLDIRKDTVLGSTCLWYNHKQSSNRACIYLVGGGMLGYPKTREAKGVMILAEKTGVDFILPYYPLVYTGHTLPDVYETIYTLYKQILNKYSADNIYFLGSSSGANLALGMISYINEKCEGLPMPGKVYAGSPGSLPVTEEEKKKALSLDKTDVIMSQKATTSVWEGMTGGEKVPEYMESLQLGDYTRLKDVYLSFGGDEVFAAASDSIKERLEQFGVSVKMEVAKGMYHCYSTIPLVKDAKPGYYRMIEYIKK